MSDKENRYLVKHPARSYSLEGDRLAMARAESAIIDDLNEVTIEDLEEMRDILDAADVPMEDRQVR